MSPTLTRVSRLLGKNKKYSFTLAEVLITLAIIGIIAAMTVPNLLQNWEKQIRITQVKVAKSLLTQAFTMATIEHGNPKTWNWDNQANFAGTYIFPFLKTSSILPQNTTAEQARKMFGAFTAPFTLKPNENRSIWSATNGNLAILTNGMKVGVVLENSSETEEDSLTARIYIDVNGGRGATKLGNDVFVYAIKHHSGQLITDGGTAGGADGFNTLEEVLTKHNNGGCNNASLNAGVPGLTCARVLELNGWEWPEDYPIKKF